MSLEPNRVERLARRDILLAVLAMRRVFSGTSVETNSFHHQGVKDVAPGLRPVGWSPDGLVEGVEHPDSRFIVGVQWHPEAMVAAHPEHQRNPRKRDHLRQVIQLLHQLHHHSLEENVLVLAADAAERQLDAAARARELEERLDLAARAPDPGQKH